MSSWNFITNYGAVLSLVARQPQITAKDIATQVGITERSVLRIIADLEFDGYLRRSRAGRVNCYEVNADLSMRRYESPDVPVGDLLSVLMSKRVRKNGYSVIEPKNPTNSATSEPAGKANKLPVE